MIRWILAAGAAALALTAPALAGPDKDRGGERGHKMERGGGKHDGHRAERAERGKRDDRRAERRMERRDERKAAGRAEKREEKAERRFAKAERRDEKREEKAERRFDRLDSREHRDDVRRLARIDRQDDRGDREDRALRRFEDDRRFAFARRSDDCPPGLARKGNGCLPPGQAKRLIGAALPVALGAQMLEGPYRQWYRDDDQYSYRDDGDYIYRVSSQGGLVDALFPFQDRDYSYYDIGTPYPADYDFYNVPQQYQSYYADGTDYSYRYGDGAIYQVDRSNNLIQSIVALLAGDLAVGQPLPDDYGVYNVPMAFRDRYADTPDALYRYNDGYIYQADAKTRLITAVIDALA